VQYTFSWQPKHARRDLRVVAVGRGERHRRHDAIRRGGRHRPIVASAVLGRGLRRELGQLARGSSTRQLPSPWRR
jgi:hypothetical protein